MITASQVMPQTDQLKSAGMWILKRGGQTFVIASVVASAIILAEKVFSGKKSPSTADEIRTRVEREGDD